MPAAVGRNMREKLIVRLEVYCELKEKVNDVNKDSNLVNKDNNLLRVTRKEMILGAAQNFLSRQRHLGVRCF